MQKTSKYKAKKTEYVDDDGTVIVFDSKLERDRYVGLKSNPAVTDIQRQVPFELLPKNDLYRAVTYVADFVYQSGGTEVIEDTKGLVLADFKLKQKMMYSLLGKEVHLWPERTKKTSKRKSKSSK